MPVLEYASAVWRCDDDSRRRLHAIWNTGVRRAAGVHDRTSIEPLVMDLELFSLESRWHMYAAWMVRNITATTGPYRQLVHSIYKKSRQQYQNGGCTDETNWCHRAREACEALQLPDLWTYPERYAYKSSEEKEAFSLELKIRTWKHTDTTAREAMRTKAHLQNHLSLFSRFRKVLGGPKSATKIQGDRKSKEKTGNKTVCVDTCWSITPAVLQQSFRASPA